MKTQKLGFQLKGGFRVRILLALGVASLGFGTAFAAGYGAYLNTDNGSLVTAYSQLQAANDAGCATCAAKARNLIKNLEGAAAAGSLNNSTDCARDPESATCKSTSAGFIQ